MPSRVKEDLVSPGRRGGRPPWRPPDLRLVEQLAQLGMSFDRIATILGINRATFFRQKKASKEFCEAIRRGRTKGLQLVSNMLLEQVKANNLTATIRLLMQLGWNKRDSRACPDPLYATKIRKKKWRKKFRLLSRYMTVEEQNRISTLKALTRQRKKAAGPSSQAGREKVRDDSSQRGEEAKPASPRTGRPPWSPPELSVVTDLAERGLSLGQIALSLGVSKATLFRKIRSDEDFAQAIATGRARVLAFASGKLFEQARNGNLRAMIFYLRTVHGWGVKRPKPEHKHERRCTAQEREKTRAELRLLTEWELQEYVDIISKADVRMKEAGVRIPDDGLDEWGNLIKPPE